MVSRDLETKGGRSPIGNRNEKASKGASWIYIKVWVNLSQQIAQDQPVNSAEDSAELCRIQWPEFWIFQLNSGPTAAFLALMQTSIYGIFPYGYMDSQVQIVISCRCSSRKMISSKNNQTAASVNCSKKKSIQQCLRFGGGCGWMGGEIDSLLKTAGQYITFNIFSL